MKVKTKATTTKAAPAAKPKAKAAPAAKKAAAKNGGERKSYDNDALRPKVAAGLAKGKSVATIAEELGIASGKAAYLNMLNMVDDGEVPTISTAGGDDKTAQRIAQARNKQDAYSSWGWISARVGIPESRVKAMAEEAGVEVKGSQIAKERAAAKNGDAKPKTKAAPAKKRGRPKKEAADPSS